MLRAASSRSSCDAIVSGSPCQRQPGNILNRCADHRFALTIGWRAPNMQAAIYLLARLNDEGNLTARTACEEDTMGRIGRYFEHLFFSVAKGCLGTALVAGVL